MKILKILGLVIAGLLLVLFIGGWIASEKKPVGKVCQEADDLAQAMMVAVDKPAWDTTHWLKWTFAGNHHYVWDKQSNMVQVSWDEFKVLLYTKELTGKAYKEGTLLEGKASDKAIQKAWGFFANDSFWLNPVVKAFDSGTERSLVTVKDGREGVMVQYKTGGVTPGDSYVWFLDANNKPEAWKMWVKIIPIGGIGTTWEGWKTLSTGAQVSTVHGGLGRQIEMIKDVKGEISYQALGLEKDPFVEIR